MGYRDTFGIKMLGGTLLQLGTEEQKRRYRPRILRGDGRSRFGPDDLEHLPDGVHPDAAGYLLMAERFAAQQRS
jgi:lysophospholipase L1-like esterase